MQNKGIFSKIGSLWFFSVVAAALALLSIYFCFFDDFSHSIVLFFDYLLLFILVVVVGKAFKKGEKEIVKIGTASIYTLTFLVFVRTFVDIIHLNNYYLFTTNYVATLIGVVTIILFLLFAASYTYHFAINASSGSSTRNVQKNKAYLIIISLLCFANAGLIYYNDIMVGRKVETFLILTYIMYGFVALVLTTIETLINNFRIAKEHGKLESFSKKLVGEKATNVALGKKDTTKKTTKAKKATKKTGKK